VVCTDRSVWKGRIFVGEGGIGGNLVRIKAQKEEKQ
jgi:hypothetical protein